MSTSHVTDHVARAVARLRQQYVGKANIEAWISGLVEPIQRLEDALWQLLTERGIDEAIGAQLDRIGQLVGQVRDGRSDTVYRRFIRAQISTNKSNATVEDILTVTRLVLDDDSATLKIVPQYPAAFALRVLDTTVDGDVASLLVVYFLRRAVAAGVRLVLETQPVADAALFRLAGGAGVGLGLSGDADPSAGGQLASSLA